MYSHIFDHHCYGDERAPLDAAHLLFQGGGGDADGLGQHAVHPRHDVTELLLWDHAALRYVSHRLPAVSAFYAAHQSWTQEQGCFVRIEIEQFFEAVLLFHGYMITEGLSEACWLYSCECLVQSGLWFNIQSDCDGCC